MARHSRNSTFASPSGNESDQPPDRSLSGRGTLIANYRFENSFRGLSIGGAGRWRNSDAIGYGKPNPLIATGQVADITRLIRGDDILVFDTWIAYERDFAIAGHKLNWNIQLNVRNLLNDDNITPVSAYYDGTYTADTRNESRTVILTNTIKF